LPAVKLLTLANSGVNEFLARGRKCDWIVHILAILLAIPTWLPTEFREPHDGRFLKVVKNRRSYPAR
jgi:hypothetical protein